jgi:hypothetical protein
MTNLERNYHADLSQQKEFNTLLTEIDTAIGWEEASLLNPTVIIRGEINREIAEHMFRLKRHLDLTSHPRLELLQENNLHPEEKRKMGKVWGDAFLSRDIPQGRIRISPKHLAERVNEKLKKTEVPVYPIGGIVAHEYFHIWQFINNPLKMQRDLAVINRRSGWEEAWICTDTEVSATEFERYWIENWMDH